ALSYLELGQDFHWSASCIAALEDKGDRRRFGELAAAVGQLSGFVGRKVETAAIERWMAERGSCLVIRGPGGSGKTSLLRHLWVRSARTAILVPLDAPRTGGN